mgnify:CR=1 FL=1
METWVSPLRAPVPAGALCYVRGKGRVAAPAEPDRRVVPLVGRGKARALVLCAESNIFRDLARTQVAPDDRVLEIGCSYGEATAILAATCPTVLGVDPSRTVLKTAAEVALLQRGAHVLLVGLRRCAGDMGEIHGRYGEM